MKDKTNAAESLLQSEGPGKASLSPTPAHQDCSHSSCPQHTVQGHSHPLQLQGRAEIAFPCEFIIKAIGLQSDDLAAHTHSLIVKHAPDLRIEHLQLRASSKGKYLSVSATINAVSREQLDNIYRELNSDPRILYTL